MKINAHVTSDRGGTDEFLGVELVSVHESGALIVTHSDMSQYIYAPGEWVNAQTEVDGDTK